MSNDNPLKTLGLSYEFIEEMPLDELRAYAKEQRKIFGRLYHPDKKGSPFKDEEKFKKLSGAIDDVCDSEDGSLEEWRKQLQSSKKFSESQPPYNTSTPASNLSGANSLGLLSSLLLYLRQAKVNYSWNRLGCDSPSTFRCPVIEKSIMLVEELIHKQSERKPPSKEYSSPEEELADLVESLGGKYRR
jgi:hypothetical protein